MFTTNSNYFKNYSETAFQNKCRSTLFNLRDLVVMWVSNSSASKAMRIFIKWKLCIPFVFLLIFSLMLLYQYQVFVIKMDCVSPRGIDEYCNNPSLPEQGSEGDVPFSEFKLASVHMITRHGDRSPIHILDAKNIKTKSFMCYFDDELTKENPIINDFIEKLKEHKNIFKTGRFKHYGHFSLYPNSIVCPPGTLTPRGSLQQIRNGLYLQGQYRKHGLFDHPNYESNFQIITTNYNRTFQTALSFLYGFLPNFNLQKLKFETATQINMCRDGFGLKCSCPATIGTENTFSCTFEQSWLGNSDLYERISRRFRLDPNGPNPKPSHVYDFLVTHYCHNQTLIDNCLLKEIFAYVHSHGIRTKTNDRYIELSTLKMLPLLAEITERMTLVSKESSNNDGGTVFVLYSGHDTTIEPFTTALGIGSGYWPKYCSRVIIEQYKEIITGQNFIRILIDGVPVTHLGSFCHGDELLSRYSLCPLQAFVDVINQKASTYRSICYRNIAQRDRHVTEKVL